MRRETTLFLLLSLVFTLSSAHAIDKWSEYYSLVKKDIAKIETLKAKDLGLQVRLFELYGEKLSLLLEKENEYKIKYLETGKSKKLNQITSLQKNTLLKLETIARKIERQTRKPSILTKINYYRALNYYLVKDYNRFYFHIKKAEKTNSDPKIEYLINSKLADHHYNEGQFKQASFYYKKILGNKDNGWLTKIFYNLAWCELKLKNFSQAINAVKKAYYYEQKKGYFKVGDQLVDAILLFHAISMRTDAGLKYLSEQKISNFENLIKYLHYVFESGKRSDVDKIVIALEKIKKNSDEEFRFLEKKIVVFRPLKRFNLIQREFIRFEKIYPTFDMSKVKTESRSDLKNAIVSYTGYLQELIKSKRLISRKLKVKYVRFVASNFGVMKLIDSRNSLEYNYYEGETYFSLGNFLKASYVYANGLKQYRPSDKRNQEFIEKTFDSLFKALEKQKKPDENLLLFSLESYLSNFPKGPKSRLVYQRLVNFHQSKGETGKMLGVLKSYNEKYPSDIKVQRDYYRTVLNKYIDKKDVGALNTLKGLVDKGFLKFPRQESAKIGLVISQLYFAKYEKLQKEGRYSEALEGFDKISNDESAEYKLRVEAIRKKLYLLNQSKLFKSLGEEVLRATRFYNQEFRLRYGSELGAYTEEICARSELQACIKTAGFLISESSIKTSDALKDIYFKIFCTQTDNYEKALKLANTSARKNYLFKILIEQFPEYKNPIFIKFYSNSKYRLVIDAELERKFTNSFYSSFSFKPFTNYLSKLPFQEPKLIYSKKISRITNLFSNSNFNFTRTLKSKNFTAEQFGAFGNQFNKDLTKIINKINTGLSALDPNFTPYYLSLVIKNFRGQSDNLKKFVPMSSDVQLEKAMNDELAKLHQFLDQKLIEYQQLYLRSINNTSNLSGARKYNKNIMTVPIENKINGLGLWQN